jgi:hypothetical protein
MSSRASRSVAIVRPSFKMIGLANLRDQDIRRG